MRDGGGGRKDIHLRSRSVTTLLAGSTPLINKHDMFAL